MLALKALALPVVALCLASTSSAPPPEYIAFQNVPGVHLIDCTEGSGTAFRIGPHHLLSAAHVTAMHGCAIDGAPATVIQQDGARDFAQIDANVPGPGLKVSCEGYRAGEWVWAVGYAHGAPFQTAIALYATYLKAGDGKRVLIGPYTVIPGMSGGPIMNARGEVVGIVNAFIPDTEISFSRELKDTDLCQS